MSNPGEEPATRNLLPRDAEAGLFISHGVEHFDREGHEVETMSVEDSMCLFGPEKGALTLPTVRGVRGLLSLHSVEKEFF